MLMAICDLYASNFSQQVLNKLPPRLLHLFNLLLSTDLVKLYASANYDNSTILKRSVYFKLWILNAPVKRTKGKR